MAVDHLIRDTSYVVVFDVSRQGYQTWREAWLPASVTAVAVVLTFATRRIATSSRDRRLLLYSTIARFVVVLGLAGTLASLVYTWREFEQLSGALTSRNYRNTTGVVTGLVPERPDGHPRETFHVNNVVFEYSSSDVTSAFHHTVGTGGPLREGLGVRIADTDGRIVRLETISGALAH